MAKSIVHTSEASANASGPRDQLAPQYTPGPWRVLTEDWKYQFIKAGDRTVAEVTLFGDSSPHDARLIALAPELLEALRAIVRRRDEYAAECLVDNGQVIGEDICIAKARTLLARVEAK